MARRALLLVADSLGVGALPDAAAFGDAGADTLGHIARHAVERGEPLRIPNLAALGLASLCKLAGVEPAAQVVGAYGRAATAGPAKDTLSGHWELAGVRVDTPFQTYMDGFPAELIAAFERVAGVGCLGNVAASGTEIIERLGAEHLSTGRVIVYTSSDSVFQVAAHDDVVPLARLHAMCEAAFEVVRVWGVARVIARPFVGVPGAFVRTEGRRDYALQPPRETLVDRLRTAGQPTVSVGKVASIFGDRGFSDKRKAGNNTAIFDSTLRALDSVASGLVFPNLVDFDMLYGHRRDAVGYARALEALDARMPELLARLGPDDLLVLTADHGNDPTAPGSDHTREYVPVLAWRRGLRGGVDLGTRSTLADVGATLAEWLGVRVDEGTSFLGALA
jgi:phosphopentomutase